MDLNDEDRGSDAAQGLSDSPTMEASTSVTFSSPPIEQRAGNKSQYSGNNGNTPDRKRSRRAMADDGALDDILGQITSKLTTLSTTENLTEEDSINAFVDVLNCARSEAQFFLESSNWNVETAAMLWLENNPTSSYSSSYQAVPYAGNAYVEAGFYNSKLPAGGGGSAFQRPRIQPRYRPRTVVIEGLPKEWTARVSKHTGQVYFIHIATGGTQYSVPTGYADLPGSGSPENALDLSVPEKTKHRKSRSHHDSTEEEDEDEDMLDVSKDSDMEDPDNMEDAEIEPLSPVADPLGINMMQNTIAQAQYSRSAKSNSTSNGQSTSGSKSGHSGLKSGTGGESAFRDAMDEYSHQSDANSVNSSKAVWDEGSGYSLNDGPAYSVSSTTTNSSLDDGSVFGSMNNRNSLNSSNTNYPGNNNNNNNANGNANLNLPYYAQHLNTQESAPTPTEGHLFSAHSSGIAMLTPSDASVNGASTGSGGNAGTNIDTGDYFLGPFTPGREQWE